MSASPWPGYPVLNDIDLFLRTYMVVFFYIAKFWDRSFVVTVILRSL